MPRDTSDCRAVCSFAVTQRIGVGGLYLAIMRAVEPEEVRAMMNLACRSMDVFTAEDATASLTFNFSPLPQDRLRIAAKSVRWSIAASASWQILPMICTVSMGKSPLAVS